MARADTTDSDALREELEDEVAVLEDTEENTERAPEDMEEHAERAPERPAGNTYEAEDFINFDALLSKRKKRKRSTFHDIFGGREAENAKDKRALIRKHRNDIFVKFVDKETLTKLLVQSGLMTGRTRLGAKWDEHDFIPGIVMALSSLCHPPDANMRKESADALKHAMKFAVLLEKVPYAKYPKQIDERAQYMKHASFFGNYQAFNREENLIQKEFPYDALHLLVNPKAKGSKNRYEKRPWENDTDGARVKNVDFPQGQIQRNLIQFKDNNGIPWSKFRVRGICAMHWSLTHGITKRSKPGPMHIAFFCVAKTGVTQVTKGSQTTTEWAIQNGPLQYGGKRLMFEVLKYAKRLGIDWVELKTSYFADARCFYQSMGFRCLGKVADRKRRLVAPADIGLSENQFEAAENFLYPEFLSRIDGAMIINLSKWDGKSLPVKWGRDEINWPIRTEEGECIQCISSQEAHDEEIEERPALRRSVRLAAARQQEAV